MDESIKLAVTVRSALASKYTADALKKIDAAVDGWIAAEKARGINTVLVGLDAKKDMEGQGLQPIQGKVTALKAKKAIDALAKKLSPDYIVILGGDDVVPQFHVPNPSFSFNGDEDETVPTDNPYATSRPFAAASTKSYLVPDRVVGRLPDLPASKGKGRPDGHPRRAEDGYELEAPTQEVLLQRLCSVHGHVGGIRQEDDEAHRVPGEGSAGFAAVG